MKIIGIVALVALLASCSSSTTKQNETSKSPSTEKMQTEAVNPKYVISIKQGNTKLGDITIELFPKLAPKHVANFENLVSTGFYDGTAFHRVIPGFMIQGGDPNSKSKPRNTWGMGDPSLKRIDAEFNATSHKRGILSAARTNDPNSATSQFFICVADATFLDRQYTVYGQVVSGMEVADKVVSAQRDANDNPLEKIEMSIKKLD